MNDILLNQYVVSTYKSDALNEATRAILDVSVMMRRCSYAVAATIAKVDKLELYKSDGFKSVHEWTEAAFGFKKSASYTLLKIGSKYMAMHDADTGLFIEPGSKGKRKEEYGSNLIEGPSDFTISQIEKMLPLKEERMRELISKGLITPYMSCKEIADVVKVVKAGTANEDSEAESTSTNTQEAADNSEIAQSEVDNEADDEIVDSYILVIDQANNEYWIPESVLMKYKYNPNKEA